MSGNVAITGVRTTPGQGGSVPLRREIRDLQSNFPDQFNLYVLGLQNLEGLDENEDRSYYQIAGIHGLPYKPWNGVGSSTNWRTASGFGGYCTHSSVLFTTWHRPYVALYEQALYNSVQTVAQRFPAGNLRDKYTAAAKDFRAPYFDWAMKPPSGTSAFPTAIASANISVVDVDGNTKSIANPINRFIFHPVNPSPGDFDSQWSRYPTTVRYPDRNGRSQESRIAPILANELASLRSNVSLLLLSYKEFDAFSFNRWDDSTNNGAYGSLEDVHNSIHDRVGGGGHMSSLEAAAFDPIFWLHHANVDRLWAMWQDLNPDSFITPKPAPVSTFNVNRGAIESENTDLTPFWDRSGTKFWKPSQIKDSAATFGYAYPETQKWRFSSTSEYQAALRRTVTAMYGSNVFRSFADDNVGGRRQAAAAERQAADNAGGEDQDAEKPPADDEQADDQSAENTEGDNQDAENAPADDSNQADDDQAGNPGPAMPNIALTAFRVPAVAGQDDDGDKEEEDDQSPIPAALAHLAPDNKYTEWLVNVRAMKHGLGKSYRVQVFLGPMDESNSASWQDEFNSVGRVSVLGRLPDTQCAKCRADTAAGLMVRGTVPLTSALLQDIMDEGTALRSLRREDVVPYLKEELRWKVTMVEEDGEEMPACDVPGLEISVVSTEVTIGEDGVPEYSGVYEHHPEVTRGKDGGCNCGEEGEGEEGEVKEGEETKDEQKKDEEKKDEEKQNEKKKNELKKDEEMKDEGKKDEKK